MQRHTRSDMKGSRRAEIVSPDALAYVRFGLRAADDSRIVDTVKVIDGAFEGRDALRACMAPL